MSAKERTSRSAPCIFCGDVGYDMRMHYQEGAVEEVVHYCHKTKAAKGDIVGVGAEQYICIAAGKELPVVGSFDLWKKYLTKEEWKSKQKLINPDWKPSKGTGGTPRQDSQKSTFVNMKQTAQGLLPGEVPVRSPKEQHAFNTYLASMLILEDKHLDVFKKDWESSTYPGLVTDILKQYPIRSFPPADKARFANSEKFKNPTRQQMIKNLCEKFGDLTGYPFIYVRTGAYWDDQPMEKRYTFSCGEGVIFPCYDKDGYLYRYRIKNDYPDLRIKEGKHPAFCGSYGRFHHFYDKDGKHCWSFKADQQADYKLVYGPESDHSLRVNEKNLPVTGGKAEGKYTNISSVYEKRLSDGSVVNGFLNGCRSGSPYSLYYKQGEPFTVVIGTEGEKKSMVANQFKKTPLVCVPGVSAYSVVFEKDENGISLIDFLKSKGMKYFVLCYDADKEENERVLQAEASFVEELKKNNVIPLIGEWRGKFDKGLDDILIMGLDITVRRA